MHLVEFEFTKPTDDSAFEDMCARVYGLVFADPLPKINGRSGQAQAGVDVFVMSAGSRVGIQCKRYNDGTLKFKHVQDEVAKADKGGARIARLIVATTATADANVIAQVQELSDSRAAAGKFPVEVEFWQEICRHIKDHPRLLRDYAPNAPGGAFYAQEEHHVEVLAALQQVKSQLGGIATDLPSARPDSVNKLISGQLDHINELLKACQYEEAEKALTRVGTDLEPFDTHQKARWYLQRGICTWHRVSGEAATADFFKAAEIFPDDEKMAAAKVRALLLSGETGKAVTEGKAAVERFPSSAQVWLTHANARMAAGDFVTRADIPPAFSEDADVLQLVGWARHAAGDNEGAVEASQAALACPNAGFYVRLAAMGIAVQAALVEPVAGIHGMVDDKVKEALRASVMAMEPWDKRVFFVQATKSVEEAVAMLAYGYLLLKRGEQSLDLLKETKEHGVTSPRLQRAEIDALRDLGRREDVIGLVQANLEVLDDEALLLAAEAAGNTGGVALVQKAARLYGDRHNGTGALADMFKALEWVARSNSSPAEQATAVADIHTANLAAATSLPLLLGGVRVLFKAGAQHLELAAAGAARVSGLVSASSSAADRLSAADLLFDVDEFEKAASYYASLAKPRVMSVIHARLLECYLRVGARRKAKELLGELPPDWTTDDKARSLAIELGQQAGDWAFLEPISEVQRDLHPNRTSSWLFSLLVALRSGRMHRFHELLEAAPPFLEGTVVQTAQLASLEMRYGRAAVGMDRVYRMFRERLDDVSAAEAYFISLIAAKEDLPKMEDTLPTAGPGASVTLVDERGASLVVTIDPVSVGPLTTRGEFHSPTSDEVAPLISASVGALVELPGGMGGPRKYTLQAVTSAYKRLAAIAQETFTRSVTPAEHLMQVSIPQSENGADFSEMHRMLKEQSAQSARAFQLYAENPLTLGMLGKLLGHSPLDLVASWPVDGPPLRVSNGHADAFDAALALLERSEATYVIDAVTLLELVNLEAESVLGQLPKVLVSTETFDRLGARLEEARTDKSSGRAVDVDGQLAFIESTDADKARRIGFFERILSVIARYCEVAPAYGPEVVPADFRKLEDLLRHEEKAALLLAAERSATLITLDGRLADVAKLAFGLDRVWPQAMLSHAHAAGRIADAAYSLACARLFVGNRSFTSMRAQDLILMCLQGGNMFKRGMEQFKHHLSDPVIDFKSIGTVCLEFLRLLPGYRLTFAAYGEMLTHLCEAAFRHPACSHEGFSKKVSTILESLVSINEPDHPYPPLKTLRAELREAFGARLLQSVQEALQNARAPERPRPIHLKVLMCTKVPCILWTGDALGKESEPLPEADAVGHSPAPDAQAGPGKGYLMVEPGQSWRLSGEQGEGAETRPLPARPDVSGGVPPPKSA